nr:non-functional pseudokinase zed1 [Quercus suber]
MRISDEDVGTYKKGGLSLSQVCYLVESFKFQCYNSLDNLRSALWKRVMKIEDKSKSPDPQATKFWSFLCYSCISLSLGRIRLVDKMNLCLKMKRKAKEETSLMKNGRILLEELIAFCNGKSNSIHVFSTKELKRATNNYDQRQCILQDSDFKLFKGSLEDHLLSVKKYNTGEKGFSVMEEVTLGIVKDIVVGSQMSVHQNVLKLLRRCLETKYPTPV